MCVQEHAINPIIENDPELAKNILFGLIIEEPRRSSPHDDNTFIEEKLGIKDFQGVTPALPNSGPFLFFLDRHPYEGLDLIINLVDFATERWIERKTNFKQRFSESEIEKFSEFDSVNEVEIKISDSKKP